ncbi:MAG: hypothetical protein JO336_21770 [Acidobacteriia bacterium]|nr:hypothetical protein [Terriglobia bacterium]
MSVSLPASLPEVTAVGGTEFNEGNGTYWSGKLGPTGTATGYIPESVWNDEAEILATLGQADPLGLQETTASSAFAAGGGGVSIWFSKPQWQAGPGVPNDAGRDVPDVAFTASWWHDPYYLRTTELSTGRHVYGADGGTSAAGPVFAGIVALLNQYVVGQQVQSQAGLGSLNPMLYYLAQHKTGIFHDITIGNNQVPCVQGSTQDCGSSGIFGYVATPGYDLATGWGSVDVDTLLGTWAMVAAANPNAQVSSFRPQYRLTLPATVQIY